MSGRAYSDLSLQHCRIKQGINSQLNLEAGLSFRDQGPLSP